MSMERVGSKTVWEGRIATVRVDRFRYDDGEEADREIVAHPGSVAVVAFDGEHLYLVRQPREAVNEPALLELPAGKLDEDGEDPLGTFADNPNLARWENPSDRLAYYRGHRAGSEAREASNGQKAATRETFLGCTGARWTSV